MFVQYSNIHEHYSSTGCMHPAVPLLFPNHPAATLTSAIFSHLEQRTTFILKINEMPFSFKSEILQRFLLIGEESTCHTIGWMH